ncbi:ECM29 [Candida margitis]|uniref:ECM29 n=1 Tax=Candida margitis TaxID=1775924 RepID=UPI0022276A97|nr:ECM29 [Candida margitis]KAI5969893.1 ECM29 [Candida margitis]
MAEQEISLLNKVELRIALAESNAQLENALKIYLPPVLLKLASPDAQVRQLVFKIIQHVIPRITATRNLQLPVKALIDQVKSPSLKPGLDSTSVRLYSALFVSRGVDRISEDEKRALVPLVVERMSDLPESIAARMFGILCKLLKTWKALDPESDEFKEQRRALDKKNEQYLAFKVAKFLMFTMESTTKVTIGLSEEDIKYFTTDAGVNFQSNSELAATKLSLLQFLKSGFASDQIVLPFLVASADPSSAIGEASEKSLRTLDINVDEITLYTGTNLINFLVGIFLDANRSTPNDWNLRLKIMQLFLKSVSIGKNGDVIEVCKIGLKSPSLKLRKLSTDLIDKLLKTNKNEKGFKEFTTDIANDLRSSLANEASSNDTSYNSAVFTEKRSKYETLGRILQSAPAIFINDWSYVSFLLEAIDQEDAEVKVSIQDVLSGLSSHLNNISSTNKMALREMAREYFLNRSSHTIMGRYILVKFINLAFPFSDTFARMICIAGTGKEYSSEILEESNRGLHPHWFNLLHANNSSEFKSTSHLLGNESAAVFPKFTEFVNTIATELAENIYSPLFDTLPRAIEFAVQILVMEALRCNKTVITLDESWSVRLEKALELNDTVRNLVIEEMKNRDIKEGVNKLLSLCFEALSGQFKSDSKFVRSIFYGRSICQLLTFASSDIVEACSGREEQLMSLIRQTSIRDESIGDVCKILGIIGSHPSKDEQQVNCLLDSLESVQNKSAAILAQSYVLSRLSARGRYKSISCLGLKNLLESIIELSQQQSTYSLAIDSVSQLAMFGVFKDSMTDNVKESLNKIKSGARAKSKKFDEKSVLALGYLALVGKHSTIDELTEDERAIYEFHNSKEIESIFASAEAFVITSSGWESKLLQHKLDIPEVDIKSLPRDTARLPIILNVVIAACRDTKPSLRRAGCIWLLSLVQHCGHLDEIQQRLIELHYCFMRFLADKDEIVQDSASRGLALVYELGDAEFKELSVKSLLKSFTQSDASSYIAGSVQNDTTLFEPDVLKTNDGSISTYKDVLNLAQDAGDPSLVYKFMSLTKSSTLWSSRRGIAYGLESILSQSSLDQMLSSNAKFAQRLIPKLYRYRYDPYTSVSQSMESIWNSLVNDPTRIIKDNFDSILNELLTGMGKKEWRVRQASATAMCDLLQIVELTRYEAKIEEIWTMSFRVMDDIKESVRKEGSKLTRALVTILTRALEKDSSTSESQEVLGRLISFLLGNKGIISDSQDIKDFSIKTLLKLCKTKSKALKPYIADLIENFINLFSTLEPEVVNYLALNAGNFNIDNQEFDAKRLQNVGKSSLMDAIEFLLSQLDEKAMPEFLTKLERSVKHGVGLPSKVSGSKVLITLVMNYHTFMKPYSSKLLEIASSQIKDRNNTVSSCYAAAAGYICRICPVEAIIKYSDKIAKMYFEPKETGDERSRLLASNASNCVSKYSGDQFSVVASAFLPLAFIGRFDELEPVKRNFDLEWTEHTAGDSAIRLYSTEILDYAKKYLKSNEFSIRATLARAVCHLCLAFGGSGHFSDKNIEELIQLLIDSNKGKSWEGKEYVFGALVDFSILNRKYLLEHGDLLDAIERTIHTEIKRRNKRYQRLAVQKSGTFIHEFHTNQQLIECYVEVMKDILQRETRGKDDDSDEEMTDAERGTKIGSKSEERVLELFHNLGVTFYYELGEVNLFHFIFEEMRKLFKSAVSTTWRSQIKITELFRKIVKSLPRSNSDIEPDLIQTWTVLKEQCLDVDALESVKLEFIRLSKELLPILIETGNQNLIKSTLEELSRVEKSNVVRVELAK